MIKTNKLDLSQDFEIKFVERDCVLDFPLYTVEPGRDGSDLFCLAEIEWLM
jgi:hypothetical protein